MSGSIAKGFLLLLLNRTNEMEKIKIIIYRNYEKKLSGCKFRHNKLRNRILYVQLTL